MLVKFTEDTIVQPRETQWFQFYTPNQDKEIQPLERSIVMVCSRHREIIVLLFIQRNFFFFVCFQQNLGLDTLMKSGKLVFLESQGNHLQFTHEWFEKNILQYLNEIIQYE